MIQQDDEWLDELFICDINELERLGQSSPRSRYQHLQMSGILRRLVLDKHCLAHHATKRCNAKLMVLVPEPISANPAYKPGFKLPTANQMYAPDITSLNRGFNGDAYFLRPYGLDAYLSRTHMILPISDKCGTLQGRKINPKEIILLLANKLGGAHAERVLLDLSDGGISVDAETLMKINLNVSIGGNQSLFHQFGVIAEHIWRACAPLRDQLIALQSTKSPTPPPTTDPYTQLSPDNVQLGNEINPLTFPAQN